MSAAPPEITLPELALVALVGAFSAGTSAFAARHFLPAEVLRSDEPCPSHETGLTPSADPLADLLVRAGQRLEQGHLTVIDAALVRPSERRRLVALARQYDVAAVAIVLDLPKSILEAHYSAGPRPVHSLTLTDLTGQQTELRRTKPGMLKEGFEQVWTLSTLAQVQAAQLRRVPLPVNRQHLHGPFDFIGDVHGCFDELCALLRQLGYQINGEEVAPPPGRTAVFVGDLVDRGPESAHVLRLVMHMADTGAALCVLGNHDEKLSRALSGKAVKAEHGLAQTLAQLEEAGEDFKAEVQRFLGTLESHLVLDGGQVVAAHAGLSENYQGRSSARVRRFALYGDVDGSKDEFGLPVRRDWAAGYRGAARVVYGHTPVAAARWVHQTMDLDTGCVFGGRLTALRYPEMELVSVAAQTQYAPAPRSLRETA